MHWIQKVWPFKRPSEARSSMIWYQLVKNETFTRSMLLTDFSSASLVGAGQVPGSSVIERKKL